MKTAEWPCVRQSSPDMGFSVTQSTYIGVRSRCTSWKSKDPSSLAQHALCLRIIHPGLAWRAGGGHTITAEFQEVLHWCAPLCPWTPGSPIHPLLYGGLLHLGQSYQTGPKTALSMPLPAQPLSAAQDCSSSQALLCPYLLLSLD